MIGIAGRRRKPVTAARAPQDDTVTLERDMDRLAADATSARLFELERIHEDAMARHSQLASDYAALIDALHARSPQEWHEGDPATSALSYLRHLEDEADRCGIDRRPPWCRDVRPRDERVFRSLAEEFGAQELLGLPVPVRTEAEAAEDSQEPGSGASPQPGEDAAGPVATAALPSPTAPEPVSTEDEPVQDEPAAEADCAEDGAA